MVIFNPVNCDGGEGDGGNNSPAPSSFFQSNNWIYYIPHEWATSHSTWEDVYLMPKDELFKQKSLWLTVEAVDRTLDDFRKGWGADERDVSKDRAYHDRIEEFAREDFDEAQATIKKMGKANHWLDEESMTLYVKCPSFTKEQLLDYVEEFLRAKGSEFPNLSEGSASAFEGSNQHASAVDVSKQIANQIRNKLDGNG